MIDDAGQLMGESSRLYNQGRQVLSIPNNSNRTRLLTCLLFVVTLLLGVSIRSAPRPRSISLPFRQR